MIVSSTRNRRTSVFATCVSGTLAAGALLGTTPSVAASAERACALLTVPLRQLVSPKTEKSLLTPWAPEASGAKNYGYTLDRGAYLRGSLAGDASLVATKRLYNATTRDFVWSAQPTEIASLTAAGYQVQRTDFFASPRGLSCTVPITRLTKGTSSRMATPADTRQLLASGWTSRGVAFHAPAAAQGAPAEPDRDADGRFSLAVYPDTQMEVMSGTDQRLSQRNSYVIAQRQARDIRYVVHVGDLVNWDTASPGNPNDHRQFDWASRQMQNLEAAAIPWASALGNHDTNAVGPSGGSARPGVVTARAVRDTRTFNTYFSVQRFGNIAGTFEPGKVDNAYRMFDAVGRKWMVLNLELWPRAAAVDWARNVVAGNPDRNVIVVTHSYLTGKGTIDQSNGGYGATSPQYLYDRLIRVYPNIKLVFSGHVNTSAVRTDTGFAGNRIVSILTSFHSRTTNEVRFVEIDAPRGTLSTDIYAPWTSTARPEYSATVSGLTWR